MDALEFEVDLEPVPKARNRVSWHGGKVHSYTPAKTAKFTTAFKQALEPYKDRCFPADTPLRLTICFYRTKSHWLKVAEKMPWRKPDLDNMLKNVDCFNGIIIKDDAAFTTIITKKRWTTRGYGYITIKIEGDVND
jgi:Holliday junction resolvase RusA-like endonuclease